MTHFCSVFPTQVQALQQAWSRLRQQRDLVVHTDNRTELQDLQIAFAQHRTAWARTRLQTQQQATNMKTYLESFLARKERIFRAELNSQRWLVNVGCSHIGTKLGEFLPEGLESLDINASPAAVILKGFGGRGKQLENLYLYNCPDIAVHPDTLRLAPPSLKMLLCVALNAEF